MANIFYSPYLNAFHLFQVFNVFYKPFYFLISSLLT